MPAGVFNVATADKKQETKGWEKFFHEQN